MSLIEVLLLAVVQGITEFLPISSSGHLVVVSELLGAGQASAEVNVVLHAGTLLSILVFFRRRILRLLAEDRRVIWLLILGTLPAAVLGLTVRAGYREVLENPLLAGFMLVATGLMLLMTVKLKEGVGLYSDAPPRTGLVIGLFQALALLPGMSRSGATIFGGLLMGLGRQSAATFSFLLAIPAIGGASMLEIADLVVHGNGSASVEALVLGCLVSFGVGLVALGWLFRSIESGKLHYFAYWCLPLGVAVIAWQLAG